MIRAHVPNRVPVFKATAKAGDKARLPFERLEVPENPLKRIDVANIVRDANTGVLPLGSKFKTAVRDNDKDFVDDPDVPPLS